MLLIPQSARVECVRDMSARLSSPRCVRVRADRLLNAHTKNDVFRGKGFAGLGAPFGRHVCHLGAIWGAFWGHSGDFFRISWIFKKVCFTIVKP